MRRIRCCSRCRAIDGARESVACCAGLSLDELPQLLNVLVGNMSLVGPRAQVPDEVAQYDTWARHRLRVLPGLTGLWQVSGRSDLPFEEMVMLDTYYVAHWSLGLDLRILLKTIPAVVTGHGAY